MPKLNELIIHKNKDIIFPRLQHQPKFQVNLSDTNQDYVQHWYSKPKSGFTPSIASRV